MTLRPSLLLSLLLLAPAPAALAQAGQSAPPPAPAAQALNDKLWEAVRAGDAAAARQALDAGADVNARFRYGQTPLFKAAERGNAEIVRLLLERGADPDVRDTFYGDTALTWPIDKGNVEIVRVILSKSRDSAGRVLMAGVQRGSVELVSAALERGGLKPETLTAALFAAQSDEPMPAVVELLKKAGAAPPPEVPAATLQAYAGSYRNEQGTVFNITVKDGKLFGSPAGQEPRPLMALDQTTFRPVREGIVFTFNVEGDKVTGFNLKQGANTTPFKRQ